MRRLLILFCLSFSFIAQSQTATEYFAKGNQLKTDKKISDALAAYKEATKLDPNYKEAWYEMGWCQNDSKDYLGALTSLRKSRALGFDYAKLYFELGYAFQKLEFNDSAKKSYNKCLEINPTYSLVYKQLGTMAYDKDDYKTGLEQFAKYESYTKTTPTDYLYWYRKGFMQNAQKLYADAKISLKKSMESKNDYFNSYLEMGFACSRLKENDDAIAYYEKAIQLDPKSHIGYNGIGEVYRDNIKDRDKAMDWYKKALEINPNERKANFGVAYCLNSKGRYSEAIPYLKTAIQNETDYVAAYVELGYSYFKTNSHSLALENLNKAMQLNPSNENSRYYATEVYIAQKNKTMAQKMVDQLKTLNSKYVSELQEKVNKL